MTGYEPLRAIVAVRCAVCFAKYGRGTQLGEMLLWPESDGGRMGVAGYRATS